jgi:hypothetical protein
MQARLENWHAKLAESVLDMALGLRQDGCADPSQKNPERNLSARYARLGGDQLHLPRSLFRVELRALHGDHDEIGESDGVADEEVRGALEVDDHERRPARGRLDGFDDRLLTHIAGDREACWPPRELRPVDDFLVRVRIDHSNRGAALGENRRQDDGAGCFSASPFGRTERESRAWDSLSSTVHDGAERLPKS